MHKLRYLDGLRGLAAFIVVLHHFAAAFYPAAYLGLDLPQHSAFEGPLLTSPLGILIAGNFSVCVFFILSGFVLTRSYFGKGDESILRSLAVRRYFRLLPPVLFSSIVAWLFMHLGWFPTKATADISGSSRWLALCWDFDPDIWGLLKESFFGVFLAHQSNYNNVLWTMGFEFCGSFLVFSFAALAGKQRIRPVAYMVVGYLFLKSYYLAFLMGVLLADIDANRQPFFSRFSHPIVTAVLVVVGLFLGAYPPFKDIVSVWYNWLPVGYFGADAGKFYHILGALFLMVALFASSPLQSFFQTRLMLFLGKISFSLYAIHVLIIGSLSSFILIALHRVMPYNAAAMISLAVTILTTLYSAHLVNRWIDEPGIRLSRRIEAFLNGSKKLSSQ